jgi:hypothetical protein
MILTFYSEGQGIIVHTIYRSGENTGLFVKLKDGTEVQIFTLRLWQKMKEGDFLSKKRFSFIYQLNEEKYNAFFSMMKTFFILWGILLVLYIVGLLYTGVQKGK